MNTKYNNILTQLINARRAMTFEVLDARLVRISDKKLLKALDCVSKAINILKSINDSK